MSGRGEGRPFVALGFASVHDTLDAEATLRRVPIAALAIPSPRELGELCGLALRLEREVADQAERALADAGKAPVARAEFIDL